MEERNIKISLEKAKEWYNGNDSSLKELALQAFNMNELEEPKLPKSWEEYSYSTLAISDNYLSKKFQSYSVNTDILTRLLILRDVYRQGWKPDWGNTREVKWTVYGYSKNIEIFNYKSDNHIFSFPTKELAQQFLENFRDKLEQLKDLL